MNAADFEERRRPAVPIIGRSVEIAVLGAVIDAVARGSAQMAVVEGAAGIGKTRLIDEVLAVAGARGIYVLRGRVDELDRDRPFSAIAEALALDPRSPDTRRAAIGRLLVGDIPAATTVSSPGIDLSFRVVDGVVALVEELCADQPVVLALEDFHWADDATVRTVRSLARRLTSTAFGLLVSLRPASASQVDEAVVDLVARGARHLRLSPLQPDDAASLASAVIGSNLGPRLRTQVAAAGGVPLFVIELVEALRDEGAIGVSGGAAEVGELSLPPSLRLTILRRLAFLPRDTLELLKVAAVLGTRFSLGNLAAVTRKSAVELLPTLTDALRAGVIGEAQDQLTFRHALIRQAIYEELPAGVRKDLHREAGRSLAEAGAPVARVAEQMSLGAAPGDAEVVGWLRKAANEAATRSAPVAVRLLERARELVRPGDPHRHEIVAALVTPLLTVGRLAEAEAAARDSIAREHDPASRLQLQRALATILFFRGDRSGARDVFTSIAQAADSPADERAVDLSLAGLASVYVGDLDGARTFAEAGRQATERGHNSFAALVATMTVGVVARVSGYAAESVVWGEQARLHASTAETPWAGLFVHPTFHLGASYIEADRLKDAEESFRFGREMSQSFGSWHIPWYQMYLAARHFAAGDWDDAVAEARAGLSLIEDMELTPFAAVLFPQGLLAAIAVERGDHEVARAAIAAADEELIRSGPQAGLDAMLWAKALLLEAEGRVVEARATVATAWAIYHFLGYYPAHRWVGADLVRMAVEADDRGAAETVVAELETLAQRAGVPTARGVALRCRGLVDDDEEKLIAAVEAYRAGPRPFERALACEDAAAALARSGRLDLARGFFDEAVAVYEAVDAARALSRIEAKLRSLGVRRGCRGARRRPASGWESLTKTELRVAELAARGLTNRAIAERLFISRRTVETHVAHLFQKLAVASRAELIAQVINRLR